MRTARDETVRICGRTNVCSDWPGVARASQFRSFQELSAMDANADGKLTFDEMTAYFTTVGHALSEDEFNSTVDDMILSGQKAQAETEVAEKLKEASI